jgi:ABC-2 type transport system permease protein
MMGDDESSAKVNKFKIGMVVNTKKNVMLENVFIDKVLKTKEIKKMVSYSKLNNNNYKNKLKHKSLDGVVIFPNNFTNDYMKNKKVNVKVITNTDNEIHKTILKGITEGYTSSLNTSSKSYKVIIDETIKNGVQFNPMIMQEIEAKINNQHIQTKINYIAQKGKKVITSFEYYSAAMAVMFILFAAGFGAKSILEERENLTLSRIVISGTKKYEILLGKFLGILGVALMQMLVMILFSQIAFGVSWGKSILGIIILTLASVFAVGGLGVMIGGIAKTDKGIGLFQSLVVQIMSVLGGSMLPIYVMPKFMQSLSKFTINGQTLRGYVSLMEGGSLSSIQEPALVLVLSGIIFFIIGSTLFKVE